MERRQVALQESLAFRLARGSGQAAAWHLGRNGNVSPRQLTRRAPGRAGIESQALGATLAVHARRDGADQVIARRDGRLALADGIEDRAGQLGKRAEIERLDFEKPLAFQVELVAVLAAGG